MHLEELIQLCNGKKKNVCVVGGGGKSSLIAALAEACAAKGKKVLVTTTTHIVKPTERYACSAYAVDRLWDVGDYAVIGKPVADNKLTFDEALYKEISCRADLVLIEADGAKKLPCKIPAAHEPVITEECDLVIGVMGMTAIGKVLKEICFRFESEGAWLEASGEEPLSPKIAAQILCDEKGTRKNVEARDYIVVLNQCDDEKLVELAEEIKTEIEKRTDIPVICTCLQRRN